MIYNNLILKSIVLFGGVIIALIVIFTSIKDPEYFKNFFGNDNTISYNNSNNLNSKYSNISVQPATTIHIGEEGNHDYPINLHDRELTETIKPSPYISKNSDKFNIKNKYSMGTNGDPISGISTQALGEEGNPAYPQITSNIHGEESTEFNNNIDFDHTYDYAGLGKY